MIMLVKDTLANCLSLELGSLDVVIIILGSSTPAHLYSSSTLRVSPETFKLYSPSVMRVNHETIINVNYIHHLQSLLT